MTIHYVLHAVDDTSAGSLRTLVAAAAAGDTIIVPTLKDPSTAKVVTWAQKLGSIAVTKSMTIKGLPTNEGDPTAALAAGNEPIFKVSGISTVFTLKNLSLTGSSEMLLYGGAAISAPTKISKVVCTNVLFTSLSTTAANGGAVAISECAQASFTNCRFTSCTVGCSATLYDGHPENGNGGAIWIGKAITAGAGLVMTSCVCSKNTAYNGGGVYYIGTGTAKLVSCQFSSNAPKLSTVRIFGAVGNAPMHTFSECEFRKNGSVNTSYKVAGSMLLYRTTLPATTVFAMGVVGGTDACTSYFGGLESTTDHSNWEKFDAASLQITNVMRVYNPTTKAIHPLVSATDLNVWNDNFAPTVVFTNHLTQLTDEVVNTQPWPVH